MAKRTVALCDGKIIGIETVYTVINGKQINIPEKLKALRELSQSNKLFCPCGCGANLIIVAGDKNLREQHFRIKDSGFNKECQMITEGKTSVDSKIVIKCWLDDNLHDDDLESRVPISDLSDSNRKYEFTFLSKTRQIAIDYCHDRRNLSLDKLSILDDNSADLKIIHIEDQLNGGSEGQYPEGLMKIQDRQGFCLLLSIVDRDYEKAELKAVFYEKDIDGLWKEVTFAADKFSSFRIYSNGSIIYSGKLLTDLLTEARKRFFDEIEEEADRRSELRRLQKEREEKKKRQEAEIAEKKAAEAAAKEEEKQIQEEERLEKIEERVSRQDKIAIDVLGNRWVKCEFCGKTATDSEFVSYGGPGHLNLGTCKACSKNNPAVKQRLIDLEKSSTNKKREGTTCPECHLGKLVVRNGRKGRFLGCSCFPKCQHTESI